MKQNKVLELYIIFSVLTFCQAALKYTCPEKPVVTGNNAKFIEIKSMVQPSTMSTSYDAQGLQPFFNLAKSFMNTVQPKSLGEQFKGVEIGELTDSANLDQLKKYEIPILVAVGFGLLFVLVMPLVGCCFCCCRLFGKCGGRMFQDPKSSKQHKKCCVMAILLFIFTIFMLCGVLFMFVTNNRMHSTSKDIGKTYANAINEAVNFANATVSELMSIPKEQVPCILSLIKEDITDNGIKLHIGIPLQNLIKLNVSSVITTALSFDTKIKDIESKLNSINSSGDALIILADQLKASLKNITDDLNNTVTDCKTKVTPAQTSECDKIGSFNTDSKIDFGKFPDISSQQQQIKDITALDLKRNIGKTQKVIDDIPTTASDKSRTVRKKIDTILADAEVEINKNIKKLADNFNKSIIQKRSDLMKYKDDYFDPNSTNFKYEDYRWYAYIGLSCIVTLIIVLLSLGLTLGICGYRKDNFPSGRTSTATCGGNCLMSAIGFMFIFSWLLMLFCIIWYSVGIHLHIVCRDIKDGKLIDDLNVDIKYNNERILVGDFLKNCRNNKALYEAVGGAKYYNITAEFDVQKYTKDIKTNLNNLKFDLTDQTILTPDAESALNKLLSSSVGTINFSGFFNLLNSKITESDLNGVATNLTNLAASFRNLGQLQIANDIEKITKKVNNIQNGVVRQIKDKMAQLETDVKDLQTEVMDVTDAGRNLLNDLKSSEAFVQSKSVAIILSLVTDFLNREIRWLTQGSDHLIKQAQTNIAKCKPVATLYDGLINTFLCDNVVQNANGFWLALGWCLLFFIPSIILAAKLAKYFRKMDYDSGYDGDAPQEPYNPHHDKILLKERVSYNPSGRVHADEHWRLVAGELDYNHPPPPYNHHQNEGYMHM